MNQPTWQDLPKEIQEEMLNEQERQGNKRDAGVFEREIESTKYGKGFNWCNHLLGFVVWIEVLRYENFAHWQPLPQKP